MSLTRSKNRLDVTVRDLAEADLANGFLDALTALSEVKLTKEQARTVYSQLAPNLWTFVAAFQDRVVGTTRLLIERKFVGGGGLVGHVEDVAVAPPFQHRGVGTALVGHAIAAAQRSG
jgi:glucosamine-phosphate N-acetyltransferase